MSVGSGDAAVATLFGAYEQVSFPALLGASPIAVWEFSLGVYLTVKGSKHSAVTENPATSTTRAVYDYVAA